MARRNQMIPVFLAATGMLALILDSKTAVNGAAEGIDICVRTVIPSLLPFFVLSILLTNTASGIHSSLLSPIGRLCGIPDGAVPLLLVGLLGGYPVGAQAVAEAYESGYLTKKDAHRMLGFCSNAGPAFIFGIAGCLFSAKKTTFILWLIHIISALIVAITIPGRSTGHCTLSVPRKISLPYALNKAIKIMAGVCGWIILFRVLIAFLDRWFLWMLPESIKLLITGFLELANGCCSLLGTRSEFVRFVFSSLFLSFGGLCVGMQTIAATGDLGTGWYFPGKILQTVFSLTLSAVTAQYLFGNETMSILFICAAFAMMVIIFTISKKTVAFLDNRVYNNLKRKEPVPCCLEKK